MNNFELKARIQFYVNSHTLAKLNEIMKMYHRNSMQKTVTEIVQIGIKTIENLDKINNTEKIIELQKELDEGTLVDYIEQLGRDQFQVLWSIIQNERRARYPKEKHI